MKKFFRRNQFLALIISFVAILLMSQIVEAKQTITGLIMANTFLTTKSIAREALVSLRNQLVMKFLVYPDFSNTFQKEGDTIRIKKPTMLEAKMFQSEIEIQNINQVSEEVTLNYLPDVSVNWTSKERSLNLSDFKTDILDPAMLAISEKVDEMIFSDFYPFVPNYVGESGVTPDDLTDFSNAAKVLNDVKCPVSGRNAVWNTSANAKFSTISAIVNAEKSGSTEALREGNIGRIMGLNNYWSQKVQTHVAGSFTAVTSPKVNTATVKGSYTIILKGGSGTETIKKGDIFSLITEGKSYSYAAAADANAVSGVVSIATSTAIGAVHAVDTEITFPDKTTGGHVANLAFVPQACSLVTRPLEIPTSVKEGYIISYDGLSLRVITGYDIKTKTEILSMDMLFGVKATRPELAVRILG